ncbi:MAG TPA: efflux RND transporter periplasmic adaptor subunit [Desulfitobacteriaceae bacterium]|nr:efflux RND transporter periplasmic adaptor subunit [Desulfitobacteriaceae bacterium]
MEDKSNTQNPQDLNEKEKQEKIGKVKNKRSKKAILLPILIVVVLLACSAGYYYFIVGSRYFSTDNAKVTAKMYYITPNTSGELLEWNANEGERVEKNQILGRQEALPYITSPIAGTVVKNNGVEGQIVSPTTQLAVVADTDNMYIGVNIEETDIVKIQVGQTVDVKIDAYPGKTFKGVVAEIDQTTQTYFSNTTSFSTSGTYTKVTQLIPVKVLIENEENLPLTFGMNATVKIHLGQKTSDNEAATNKKEEATGTKKVIHFSSFIEAAEQIAVTPNISGKVSKIQVEIGQTVEKGDVLFVLDSTDLELQVKQAAANYNATVSSYNNKQKDYSSNSNVLPAQTAYDEAVASYTRLQTLFEAGAISKVDLDNGKDKVATTQAQLQMAQSSAQTALDAAQAQMESAKATLAIAQKKVDDCVVKAPMAGEVASKDIAIGDLASPQTAAVTLIDAQNLKVRINVTETNISAVKIGTEAEITVPAINAVSKGTVVSIAPASDAKTGMFPVEILVNNADGKLKSGMVTDIILDVTAEAPSQTE